MPVLIDRHGVEITDCWPLLDAVAQAPLSRQFIASLPRWWAEWSLGVLLEPEEDVAEIVGELQTVKLVALRFNTFSDGRAFSQARLLRERYGYRNTLRAIGDVLPDQLAFMLGCGFDQFALPEAVTARQIKHSLTAISVAYQPRIAERESSEPAAI